MEDGSQRILPEIEQTDTDRASSSRWTDALPLTSNLSSGYEPVQTSDARDLRMLSSEHVANESPGHSRSRISAAARTPSKENEKAGAEKDVSRSHCPQVMRSWWREILATGLFLGALLALVVTLRAYTGRASPHWPSWLSLNTIVAIYIVLLKTGILLVTAEGIGQLKWSWFAKAARPLDDLVRYDDATRGPFGATVLLWRLRARDLLSSFGALIIVLCLATDPFAQQIIHYYDCRVATSQIAAIPRTNYYFQQDSTHTGALFESIGADIRRSVLAGIFSPVGPPQVQCPTGNCTWPPEYSTLGWCSSCEDITGQLIFSNDTYKYTLNNSSMTTYNLTTSLPDGSLSIGMTPIEYTSQNYSAMGATPYGVATGTPISANAASIDFLLARDLYGTFVTSGLHAGEPRPYVSIDPSTGRQFTGCNTTAANNTWRCQGYGAARCAVYSCVKTFTASQENGKFVETLINTYDDWGDLFGGAPTILDAACLAPDDRRKLLQSGYSITAGQRWMPLKAPYMNTTKESTGNTTMWEQLAKKGCAYSIDLTFMMSFASYLEGLLTGIVSGPIRNAPADGLDFTGPQAAQSFYNYGEVTFEHVDSLFANITQSLTNYIRQNGYNFSTPANGTAYRTGTCVGVRWPFLAFPSVLALLTIAFFLVVLTETRPAYGQPHIWKSSPLALLYHGLVQRNDDGGVMKHSHHGFHVEDIGRMKEMAKSTAVKLDQSSNGLTQLEIQSHANTLQTHSD